MKIRQSKTWKRIAAIVLAVMTMFSLLTLGFAAGTASNIVAELRPGVKVVIDGTEQTFYNAQGKEVHTIFYNGTHYLPVRAIGELMGKNVNWDQTTLTVTLSSPRLSTPVTGTPDTTTAEQDIYAQLRPDFTIIVDGVVRNFTDTQGRTVYPILYNGSTYLPIRAIGELMGDTVSWNATTYAITLTSPGSGSLVTDADSFVDTNTGGNTNTGSNNNNTNNNNTASTGDTMTADTAKSTVLGYAGFKSSEVTFTKTELERDSGKKVYEVDFYTSSAKYDYTIDAYTGALYEYDMEIFSKPQGSGTLIGNEAAKSAALKDAGYSASEVVFIKCERDRDDNRYKYEIEFMAGRNEYDYDIDGYTGQILSKSVDFN